MNYEKLSCASKYYYDRDMICKVQGKKFVYKFVCDLTYWKQGSRIEPLVTKCDQKKVSKVQLHGTGQPFTAVALSLLFCKRKRTVDAQHLREFLMYFEQGLLLPLLLNLNLLLFLECTIQCISF